MEFDWTTLVLQAVNFLVLVWLLHHFLYRPVLDAIDRRRAAESRALEDAAESQRAAEAERARWQAEQARLETEREALRQTAERTAAARAHEVVQEARREADRLIAHGRDLLEGERGALATEVRQEASRVARQLAERLLRDVAPDVGPEPFLERLDQHLAALPDDERQALTEATEPAPLRLLIAPAMPQAAREVWTRRLSQRLGGAAVEISVAPELIAGARLLCPATVIDVDWSQALDATEQRMMEDERAP